MMILMLLFVTRLRHPFHVQNFLQEELVHPTRAVDLAREVSEKLIRARTSDALPRIVCKHKVDKPWSLILVLSESSRCPEQ